MIPAMRIYVLALNDVFDTGLATVVDTFSIANELAVSAGTPSVHFEITVVGVRSRVYTSQGLSVPVVSAAQLPCPDIVLIPALGAKMPATLLAALERRDITDAGKLLRRWADNGALVSAACTGTFVLADTSLLDGLSATTSWWLAPLFRERYPSVLLEESRMVVGSSRFVTAGAALAHIDLALWLVRRSSPTLAALTARYLLIDPRPSQGVFMIPEHLMHADPLIERFEQWARRHLSEGFSLGAAARATGTSARTLARRLKTVLGKTPLSYFQDLRVARAIQLLRTSSDSIDLIANQVGYESGVTLRTLLRRRIGRSVSELRAGN